MITLAVGDEVAGAVTDAETGEPLAALVQNDGRISANGGMVQLTAAAARAVVDSVVNTTGVVEANSVGVRNGKIVLGAATAGTKPAGAPAQKVKVSGTVSAKGRKSGETGGKVYVIGETIEIANVTIDASGWSGGGTVLTGGDVGGGHRGYGSDDVAREATAIPNATTVTIDGESAIDVSATRSGDGGKAIVWADGTTAFDGAIAARGGARDGDGGFVEVSGLGDLAFDGAVNLLAPAGANGTLLLDPLNVLIGTGGLSAASIQTALATGNVVVTTGNTGAEAGDITVAESIAWSNASDLSLNAHRNITINNGVFIANTGAGDLNLRADATGTGVGTVTFLGSGSANWTGSSGAVEIFYNPATDYTAPTNYALFVQTNAPVQGQLAAYMLVNDVVDLQSVSQNLSGNYALGRDIDASDTANWNSGSGFSPLAQCPNSCAFFNGVFDGRGHVVDGLFIHLVDPSKIDAGLFGFVGTDGSIKNLTLVNVHIEADTTDQNVGEIGALAGLSYGRIENVHASGSVAAGWAFMGGLVGTNLGSILTSSFIGDVASTARHSGNIGGLVGDNYGVISRRFLRGEPHGIGAGTIGMLMAEMAREMTQQDPRLLDPENKEALLQRVHDEYLRDNTVTLSDAGMARAKMMVSRREDLGSG